MLFEATQAAEGIRPERIALALSVDIARLEAQNQRIDWRTFAAAMHRVSELVDNDPERLRRIGDRMMAVPSFVFLPRVARLLVSPVQLYEIGFRWVTPALYRPGISPTLDKLPDGRIRIVSELPPDFAPCEPFHQIVLGNMRSLPTLLDLPRAEYQAEVGPRRLEVLLRLPQSSLTLPGRARRALMALRGRREVVEAFEEQRREMHESIAAASAIQGNFRELFDNLPTFVLVHREGRIVWVNRTLVKSLGWSHLDDLVGRPVLELTHPSSRELVGGRLHVPVGAPVQATTIVRLLRRDGSTVTVEVGPAQAVEFRGGPARLVAGVDVSERLLLQQRLVTADRIASIGLLGAGVAHEINNPLAYALASVELATREAARTPGASPQLADSLATALEGILRVRTIVHDLRTLARSDDDPVEGTDVREVLESTLTLAANAIVGRARIVRSFSSVPLAAASGPRLGQVALNLVLNGIEAMPDDPAHANELRVRTFLDEAGRVAFEIEDTGAGIAPDVLSRIFDPFFTTKPVGRGTGLGLAICHQIVVGFRGQISVRSAPGCGSTFRVSLPLAAPAEAARSDDPRSQEDHAPCRVLVVDDEPHLVTSVRRMLVDRDYDVASVTSADQALLLLSSGERFDVILCNLMMPDMTGMELYDVLRGRWPELVGRVVFMTAGAFTQGARDFLARVPNRHIGKPFTIDQLQTEIDLAAAHGCAAE